MNTKQALQILKSHQEWRRGSDTEMGDVTELGIAIDTVIKELE